MLLLTGATGLVGSALLRRLLDDGARGALPGARPAPAGDAARARADRARRPHRPALVSQRAARRATRSCTSRPRSAISRADRSRSSTGSPPGGWCEAAAARRAWGGSCSSPRSTPPRTTARASSAPRRSPSRPCARPSCDWTVFAPSIVYAPGDPWLTLLERLALLPVMPMSGAGARVPADLGRGRRRLRDRRRCARPRARAPRRRTSSPARRRSRHTEIVGSCSLAAAARARSCTCRRRSSRARCACWRRRWARARSRRGTRPS